MCKTITWALENHGQEVSPHETNSLFYAEDFIRYFKYQTPLSIKYCIEGEMPYVVGNQKISVRPGSFFIANHGTEIECLPVPAGTRSLIVFFTEDFIATVAGGGLQADLPSTSPLLPHFIEHVYQCSTPLAMPIRTLAQRMNTCPADRPADFQELFFNLTDHLLSFNRHTNEQINRLNAGQPATRKELYRRLLSARNYMYEQWNSPLTLEDVARHACLSPYHFHRSFREAFGEAPMRWFRQLKMKKACELLEKATFSVSETALYCGFSDVFSFSKAFKRTCGVAPSAWLG